MTIKTPLVSIITPAYNAESFLAETVRSVQAQTIGDWEMLIVDDGSQDETLELARSLAEKDGRIRVYALGRNHGRPSLARNLALRESQGRYVAFLDSDDVWLPTKLERQIAFMERKNAALSFTQYRRVTQDGRMLGRLIEIPDEVDYETLLKHNVIACLTALIDTSLTGPIQTEDGWRDDFLLWLKITKMGFTAYGLQEDLARYRVVECSISRNKLRAALRTWKMYRQTERLNIAKAFYNFMHYAVRTSLKHQTF